jgi:ureidoglycolate lyase
MLSPEPIDYMNPSVPDELPIVEMPLFRATEQSLRGYGTIVTDPDNHTVEIVTWPQQGSRPIDPGTGNEGGYAEGEFRFHWQGDVLFAENDAVNDQYLLGWSCQPGQASTSTPTVSRDQLLIWHANYHPDGGQLFFPTKRQSFVTALALPGDDISPDKFVAFYFDGSFGVCIHPNIWHEAIVPLDDEAHFFDKQGRVHGRVSCDFTQEFGCFLKIPLKPKDAK